MARQASLLIRWRKVQKSWQSESFLIWTSHVPYKQIEKVLLLDPSLLNGSCKPGTVKSISASSCYSSGRLECWRSRVPLLYFTGHMGKGFCCTWHKNLNYLFSSYLFDIFVHIFIYFILQGSSIREIILSIGAGIRQSWVLILYPRLIDCVTSGLV